MPTVLDKLTRATNLLRHHLDDRITEVGITTPEYLVLRAVRLDPEATTADIRRALGMRDAAFSDVIRRTIHRGYATERPNPRDRRTRRLALSLPGTQALRIAESVHLDLEASMGTGPWMVETAERVDRLGRRLLALPPAERYADGLPLDTA
jgi:DNA-binding MarR family transcriptional regulator